jgi:hypothetical protein
MITLSAPVRPSRRRLFVILLVVVASLAVAGVASAYWRTGGSGAGNGATATTVPITVSPGTATANLYPGGTTNVVLTLTNPNFSIVRIGTLTLATGEGTGGFSVDVGHSGCTVTTFGYTTQSTGWVVPAKVGAVNGTLAVTLTNALSMSLGAANACQGASATVYLAAGP